jgi:hypothetical protein
MTPPPPPACPPPPPSRHQVKELGADFNFSEIISMYENLNFRCCILKRGFLNHIVQANHKNTFCFHFKNFHCFYAIFLFIIYLNNTVLK